MNLILVIETSGIIYSVMVGISWVAYPYLEGLVFFLLGILILLVLIIFLDIAFVYGLGDPILR